MKIYTVYFLFILFHFNSVLAQISVEGYTTHEIHGFSVLMHNEAVSNHPEKMQSALNELTKQLSNISNVDLSSNSLEILRGVKIFVDWATTTGAAQYHPNEQWLLDNGYIPEKAASVEISNAVNFVNWSNQNQPWMLLHELTHAYHHQFLTYSYPKLIEAYENARDAGIYDLVDYNPGNGNNHFKQRAYALDNETEYFSELTEAYFGENDYYPFNREQLKLHDPAGYAVLIEIWGGDQGNPPFDGTIFIDPDIITASDPTTFQSVSYTGQGSREMFDRRVNAFITVNAYLFNASFDDGLNAEIQVNPEFGNSETALVEAEKYAQVIGRLPFVLRTDVQTVWIHKGTEPFGGGNHNLLIHIGQADLYVADGILEETLVHEASHTSLDEYHASASGWLAAQNNDNNFISTYGRDYPNREDIAESFLTYLAVEYRSDRISQELFNSIVQTIPNRINYFNNQSFNMYPIEQTAVSIEGVNDNVPKEFGLIQNYPNPFNPTTTIQYAIPNVTSGLSLSKVQLKIYDLLGREVAELVNENQSAGNYEVKFNASDLTSGIYFYRLQVYASGRAVSFSEIKKMILMK